MNLNEGDHVRPHIGRGGRTVRYSPLASDRAARAARHSARAARPAAAIHCWRWRCRHRRLGATRNEAGRRSSGSELNKSFHQLLCLLFHCLEYHQLLCRSPPLSHFRILFSRYLLTTTSRLALCVPGFGITLLRNHSHFIPRDAGHKREDLFVTLLYY